MLGPVDYAVWCLGFLAEILVVVCAIRNKSWTRYFPLVFYILCDALVTFGLFYCVRHYGFSSPKYVYFYYYSDSLLTLLLFWVVIQFYLQAFEEMGASQYIRMAAAILIVATAIFSYAVVHQNRTHLTSRFVVELGQNFYFVGVVLTYVLWGAMMKLQENRTRLIQLVLGLGIFLSAFAGSYALRNMYPQHAVWRYFIHVMAIWLPASWAYTFLKVPDEARMATARMVSPAR